MNWCSAANIFDPVVEVLLDEEGFDKETLIKTLISVLQEMGWNCEPASDYWEHPLVKKCFEDMDTY